LATAEKLIWNLSLHDPWVQSIGGSLIAALIVSLVVFALRRRREALFSIGVSTIIFAFGGILEPATKYVIEGVNAQKEMFSYVDTFRQYSPTIFIMFIFLSGLLPGILTGLFVLKARSFQQRIGYGGGSSRCPRLVNM
jgi:hypothetical protein